MRNKAGETFLDVLEGAATGEALNDREMQEMIRAESVRTRNWYTHTNDHG